MLVKALIVAMSVGTLPGTSSRVDYTATGSSAAFTFTFKTLSTSHIQVYKNQVLQSTGYSVALNGNQSSSPGGTVTFIVTPPAGTLIRIDRTLPMTQESVWLSFSRATNLETELDKMVMRQQQMLRDMVDATYLTSYVNSVLYGVNAGYNTVDVSIGANANGLTMSGTGQVLQLEAASLTSPGAVTTTSQSIAGDKTFYGTVYSPAFVATSTTVGATIRGNVSGGGYGYPAVRIGNDQTLSTSGDVIAAFYAGSVGGTAKARILYDGAFSSDYTAAGNGFFYGSLIRPTQTTYMRVAGNVSTGGNPIAVRIGNMSTLSSSGDVIVGFYAGDPGSATTVAHLDYLGRMRLGSDPSNNLDAATKQYVDSAVGTSYRVRGTVDVAASGSSTLRSGSYHVTSVGRQTPSSPGSIDVDRVTMSVTQPDSNYVVMLQPEYLSSTSTTGIHLFVANKTTTTFDVLVGGTASNGYYQINTYTHSYSFFVDR